MTPKLPPTLTGHSALATAMLCSLEAAANPLDDVQEIQVEVLLKAGETWDGEPLPSYPRGPAEVSIIRLTVPPGKSLPIHRHPLINGGMLLSGELTLRTERGDHKVLRAGEPLLEVVNSWHAGHNAGTEPAVALVFYIGTPGLPLTELRPLNSEMISERFGSYGIEILAAEGDWRVSNLYSLEDGHPVTRTLAAVRFLPGPDPALAAPHAVIMDGGSIGRALKSAGWNVWKTHHAVAQLDDLGDQPALWAAMDVEDPGALAVHRYRLVAAQGEAFIGYADIIELHHPDYLDTGRLADLFDATPGSLPDDTRALLDQALAALARR